MDDIPDLACDRLGRTRRIDHATARGIGGGDIEKDSAQCAMESHVLSFEAIGRRCRAKALRHARKANFRRDIENESQVRSEARGRGPFEKIKTPAINAVHIPFAPW